MSAPYTDERFAVLMAPRQAGQRVSAKGVAAMLSYLQFTGLLTTGKVETDDEDWEDIELLPSVASHHLFVEGDAPADPAFSVGVLSWGPTRRPLPWGPGEACFWLMLDGCLWPHPDESLRDRIHQVLVMRTDARSRPA